MNCGGGASCDGDGDAEKFFERRSVRTGYFFAKVLGFKILFRVPLTLQFTLYWYNGKCDKYTHASALQLSR